MNIKQAVIILASVFLGLSEVCGVENNQKKDTPEMVLLGTMLEPNPINSCVIIQNSASQQAGRYKVGDKVSGYCVAKISRGRVYLLKDGKVSSLDFPLGGMDVEPITVLSPDERVLNRQMLAEKITSLNEAFKKVTVMPNINSGKIKGFVIKKIKDTDLAKEAGINEGDVIIMINGQCLDGIRKPWEVYKSLRNEAKVVVELIRGNDVKRLCYYIN